MKPVRPRLSLTGVTLLGVLATFNEVAPEVHGLLPDAAGETARTTAQSLRMTDAAAQARPAPPAAPAGNPLRALPLTQLSSTRERPIFSPSRRPPPPPTPVPAAPVAVRPPVKPREPDRPAVSLVGTVIGADVHLGVFLETATKNVVRLRIGEDHQGWVLRLIEADEATLVKDGEQVAVLKLPPPGEASDGLPRVATGIIPIVSNESYVDEQPLPTRAPRRR